MALLVFETVFQATLEQVWAFHEDVERALPLLSPPGSDVKIESADLPARVGQRVIINAKGPFGRRLRWVARIIEFVPPSGALGNRQARFVDIQEAGPFAAWKHEHLLEEAGPGECRLMDRITYRVPFGPLGTVANVLFVRRQLRAMFRHRHQATAHAMSEVTDRPHMPKVLERAP